MNGQKVFDKLIMDEYKVVENNIVKYQIQKKFQGTSITPTGQIINVKLPMSDETYDEPLANLKYIIAEAKKLKLELIENSSFTESKYKMPDDVVKNMTDNDKIYTSMHSFMIFRKK
jgi:hypothetical protein